MGNIISAIYGAGKNVASFIGKALSHLGNFIVEKTVKLIECIIAIFSNPADVPAPISEIITKVGDTDVENLTKEQLADELEKLAKELRNGL